MTSGILSRGGVAIFGMLIAPGYDTGYAASNLCDASIHKGEQRADSGQGSNLDRQGRAAEHRENARERLRTGIHGTLRCDRNDRPLAEVGRISIVGDPLTGNPDDAVVAIVLLEAFPDGSAESAGTVEYHGKLVAGGSGHEAIPARYGDGSISMAVDEPDTRLSFDRLASIFDDQRALPPSALAALHGAFTRLVDSGVISLVEPGAGTGRIAIPALAAGMHVTALDISGPMLDTFRDRLIQVPQLADRCELLSGDAMALPFDSDRFDAGVLAQVLYLVPNWERALDELIRVAKPGGQVMLVQERTTMSPALRRWDAAWREATDRSGYTPIPQVPDDLAAVAALRERTCRVAETELASWTFGQSVHDALAGLDRMRALYESLSDDAWEEALLAFREWYDASGLNESTQLDGTVTLMLVSGTVRARPLVQA